MTYTYIQVNHHEGTVRGTAAIGVKLGGIMDEVLPGPILVSIPCKI